MFVGEFQVKAFNNLVTRLNGLGKNKFDWYVSQSGRVLIVNIDEPIHGCIEIQPSEDHHFSASKSSVGIGWVATIDGSKHQELWDAIKQGYDSQYL